MQLAERLENNSQIQRINSLFCFLGNYGAVTTVIERRRSRARTESAIRCPIKLDLDIALLAGLQGAAWADTTGLLRHADQYAGRENKQASHHHLEGGGDERRVHVVVAHPGDDAELD